MLRKGKQLLLQIWQKPLDDIGAMQLFIHKTSKCGNTVFFEYIIHIFPSLRHNLQPCFLCDLIELRMLY